MKERMVWKQHHLELPALPRGVHLVTKEVEGALKLMDLGSINIGLLNIFIQHTSASLSINENTDQDVRADFEDILNRIVPESKSYRHNDEGPDDMPAHLKSSLMGSALSIPISNGLMALGRWQGIYLCEHREKASGRKLVLTLFGDCR